MGVWFFDGGILVVYFDWCFLVFVECYINMIEDFLRNKNSCYRLMKVNVLYFEGFFSVMINVWCWLELMNWGCFVLFDNIFIIMDLFLFCVVDYWCLWL